MPMASGKKRTSGKWLLAGAGVGLLLLAGSLGRGWRVASNLDKGLRAWNLAPPDTIFLFHIADAIRYQENFGKYHDQALSSPVLTQARDLRGKNRFLNPEPSLPLPPALKEVMVPFGKVAFFDYFAALMPANAGSGQLMNWLVGGRTFNGFLSFQFWALGFTLDQGTAWTTVQEDGITYKMAATREAGVLHVAYGSGWMLVSPDPARLREACRHFHEKTPALADDPVFQKILKTSHRSALLWIYANPPRVAELLQRGGNDAAAEVLRPEKSGLNAASWGWHSQGPHHPGFDIITFDLPKETVARIESCFPPLPDNAFSASDEGLLSLLCASRNPSAISSWPAISQLKLFSGVDSRVGAMTSTFRRTIIRKPGEAASIEWESISPATDREETGWIARAGTLPGVPRPFLELRFDYRAAIEFWENNVGSNYGAWKKFAGERGLTLPDTPPSLDVPHLFSEIRVTAGIESGQLTIYNSIGLVESGSTGLTPLTTLAAILWPEELVDQKKKLASNFEGSPTLDGRLLFDDTLTSALFLSPIFTNDHGGNVALDLLTLDFLTTAPGP